jgi:folate-binding protein YgfZ
LSCNYAPLPDEALLHFSGPDTLTFLQGQTTCDTRLLTPAQALPGACCTPQGRVVCDFLLCRLGPDHHALRLRRDIRAAAAARFGKYLLFSKAKMDPGRESWQVLACWGEQARATLWEVFGAAPVGAAPVGAAPVGAAPVAGAPPGKRYCTLAGEGFVLVQVDEEGRQFECYVDQAEHPHWLQRMASAMQLSRQESWHALQIAAGIGRIEAATVEQFIPQVLNYDLTGHISFSKGCYTGQEVIARLHYRGRAKRRMHLAEFCATDLPGGTPPAAGTGLYPAAGVQPVGAVVNSALVGAGRGVALVVAPGAAVAAGLRLGGPDGPSLLAQSLPYPLPTA